MRINSSDAALASTKASFAKSINSVLWLLTTGAQFALVWWYRKQAVFYLPKGYLAGPVAWWFAFPSAPKGKSYGLRSSVLLNS